MNLQQIHLGMTPRQTLIYKDYHVQIASDAFWGPNSTKERQHKRKGQMEQPGEHQEASALWLHQEPGHTNTSFSLSSSSFLHFSGAATFEELFSSQMKSSRFLERLRGLGRAAGCEGQKKAK